MYIDKNTHICIVSTNPCMHRKTKFLSRQDEKKRNKKTLHNNFKYERSSKTEGKAMHS